jgi:hypothetical protein
MEYVYELEKTDKIMYKIENEGMEDGGLKK